MLKKAHVRLLPPGMYKGSPFAMQAWALVSRSQADHGPLDSYSQAAQGSVQGVTVRNAGVGASHAQAAHPGPEEPAADAVRPPRPAVGGQAPGHTCQRAQQAGTGRDGSVPAPRHHLDRRLAAGEQQHCVIVTHQVMDSKRDV